MSELALTASRSLLRQHRFGLLLGLLISLVLVAPMFGTDPSGETEVAILFSLVVLGFAATSTRVLLVSSLATLWLALIWTQPFGTGTFGVVLEDMALLAICAFITESALRRALGASHIGAEELCAAVSAYLVMAVGWAAAYSALFAIDPAAFTISPADAERPWSALLYFSFATLTTLGYGDIAPATPLARAWASVEAVGGTIYLAILIAHLVSNFRRRVAAKQ